MSAYREDANVRFEIELEPADLDATPPKQRSRVPFVLGVAAVLLAIDGLLAWSLPVAPAAVGAFMVDSLVAWLVYRMLTLNKKRVLERFDERRHLRLEATDEMLELHDSNSGKRMAWELWVHWSEDDERFFLHPNPGQFHIVPKRAFPSEQAQTAFRRLLSEHIPPGGEAKLRTRQGGGWAPALVFVSLIATVIGSLYELVATLLWS